MFGDIFGGHGGFGGFEGFGGFGGNGGGRRHAQYRGADLRLRVKLSLQEVATGVTKTFKVRKQVVCSHCHGTGAEGDSKPETCPTCHGSGVVSRTVRSVFGMMQTQSECPTCHGEGTVIKNKCKECNGTGVVNGEEVVEIKIPAGVAEGMVLNVPGKGNAGQHNGINGDIQVLISEEKNDTFVRDGQDVIYSLLLDFPTATLGGDVEIPTISGDKIRISIKPGTQPGTTLRVRGKGLLLAMAESLEANQADILRENQKDMDAARGSISDVMLDRLALTQARIHAMADGIREAAELPDHVGRALAQFTRPNGMTITKVQVPLGLVAIIYESRPNVTSDAAALTVKSGNVCMLRSGKEAYRSCHAIVDALKDGITAGQPFRCGAVFLRHMPGRKFHRSPASFRFLL